MVKKFNAIRTTDTSDLVQKHDHETKIYAVGKKIPDRSKNSISWPEKILKQDQKQANLACKNDVVNFVKQRGFDNKLTNLNIKVTLSKA